MIIYFPILFFILGASLGSFYNFLICNIANKKTRPAHYNYCPPYNTKLKFYNLIPIISYFILKRQSSTSKSIINLRRPLIETLTAILFLASYLKFGFSFYNIIVLIMISLLIIITFIDIDHMIIPHSLTIFGILIFFIWQFLFHKNQITIYLSGSFFGFLLMAIFVFLGAIGGGDAMLMAMLGMFFGLKKNLLLLVTSFVIAGVFGIIALLLKKKDKKDKMPFGPFLTISALLMIFFDPIILSFYGF